MLALGLNIYMGRRLRRLAGNIKNRGRYYSPVKNDKKRTVLAVRFL